MASSNGDPVVAPTQVERQSSMSSPDAAAKLSTTTRINNVLFKVPRGVYVLFRLFVSAPLHAVYFVVRLLLRVSMELVGARKEKTALSQLWHIGKFNAKVMWESFTGSASISENDFLNPVFQPLAPAARALEEQDAQNPHGYTLATYDEATDMMAIAACLIYQLTAADQGLTMEEWELPRDFDLNPGITPIFKDSLRWARTRMVVSSPGTRLVHFVDNRTTEFQGGVLVCDEKKWICAAFRGTEGLTAHNFGSEWIKINLKAWQTPVDPERTELGRVHYGFRKNLMENGSYYAMFNALEEQRKKNPDYKIYVTGHSLGAALATLFSFKLALHYHESDEETIMVNLLSYASPRVGDAAFKLQVDRLLNLNVNRISNRGDFVASIPPVWLGDYHHAGLATYVSARDGFTSFVERDPPSNTQYFDPNLMLHFGGTYPLLWTSPNMEPWIVSTKDITKTLDKAGVDRLNERTGSPKALRSMMSR